MRSEVFFNVLNPSIYKDIPLEKWDWFEARFETAKITHNRLMNNHKKVRVNLVNLTLVMQNATKCCVKDIKNVPNQ